MKAMRHVPALVIAGTTLLLLAACTGTSPTGVHATDTLDEVVHRGEIRAGYFIEPPAVFKDSAAGEPKGTFVEAIRAIAAALKVKVSFVEVDLANFAAGLQTGGPTRHRW